MEDVEPTTLMKLSSFQLPDSTTTAQRLPTLKSSSIAAAVLANTNFIDVDVQNLLLDKLASAAGGRNLGLSMQLFDTMAQQHQDREKLTELIGKYACEKGTEDEVEAQKAELGEDSGPHEVDTGVALSRVPSTDESRLDPNNMVNLFFIIYIR